MFDMQNLSAEANAVSLGEKFRVIPLNTSLLSCERRLPGMEVGTELVWH